MERESWMKWVKERMRSDTADGGYLGSTPLGDRILDRARETTPCNAKVVAVQ